MQAIQLILLNNTKNNFRCLITRAKFLQQLTIEVCHQLPDILAPYCLVANIRNNQLLILHTNTTARASLLRYHGPNIIKHLQKHPELSNLHKATIHVRSLPFLSDLPQQQRTLISQKNAALLRNVASGFKDASLQSAFLRLARRANPYS
ncbi:DciA family protein [Candidatus Nitrosoglobus terrae]|nr:DciA family protein [Candidatus Nitrosoglobus terrae]